MGKKLNKIINVDIAQLRKDVTNGRRNGLDRELEGIAQEMRKIRDSLAGGAA